MNKGLVFIFIFLFVSLSFVSAANSDGLLQIWRNASSGANVSWVDNDGNWYMRGDINFSGSLFGDGSGLTGIEGSFNSAAWNRSGTNVFLANVGDYVGIGTSSPLTNLHVKGNTGLLVERSSDKAYFALRNSEDLDGSPSRDLGRIRFQGYDTVDDLTDFGLIVSHMTNNTNGSEESDMYFNIYDEGVDTTVMTLKNSMVGIGTTGPSDVLTIKPSAGDTGLTVLESDSSTVAGKFVGYNQGGVLKIYNGGSAVILLNGLDAGDSYFNNGNVGIGTTSPSRALHINKSTDDIIATFESGDAKSGFELKDNGGSSGIWRDTNKLYFDSTDLTGGDLVIDSSGNVGIGTDSPGSPLTFANGKEKIAFSTGPILDNELATAYTRMQPQGNKLIIFDGGTSNQILEVYGADSNDRIILEGGTSGVSLNTGGTNDLIFKTDNSEKMRILTSSGNVGIGTTSPSQTLDVRGQGNFSGTVYINNGTDISDFITGGAGNSSSWNRSGTKVILHHEGDSVGIGTDSPSAKLEVDSGSLGSGLTLQLKNDNGPKLRFYDDGESEYWDVSAEGTPDLVFTFNGTKESMRLQGVTGYLGVGLANPQRVFHANGTSRFSMENDASAVPTIVEFYTSGGSEFLGQIHGQVFNGNPTLGISAAATNNLALSTNNSWASPQLFISTAGNVGIGTTNPRAELEVNGSENANPVPSGALLLLQGKTNVNNRWGMRIDTSGDLNFDTVFGGINYTRVFFDRDGKVGINNVAPNATLHVAGDINVTSGNDVCIDGGNCLSTVIAEAGNVSGSGTLNYIPKWTASSVLGDSAISDDGTTITVNL